MSKDKIPKVISSGTLEIMGKKLNFHQLDNGKRIIEEQSMYDFLDLLHSGVELPDDKIKELAKLIKG